MSYKKIKVVAVPVNKSPYESEMTFEEIQKFVGGDVTPLHLYDNIIALVDEEASLKATSTPNRTVIIQEKTTMPFTILNNFVLVKNGDNDFIDMNESEIKEGLYIFRSTTPDSTIFI